MFKAKWQMCDITTEQHLTDMVQLFNVTDHQVGAFDTETTGLHIIASQPFLFQFGWVTSNLMGYTFTVDLELNPELAYRTIKTWHKLAKTLEVYLAHNTKYDLHMLANIGLPYMEPNLSDFMFYIRYAHNNVAPKNGGPPLKLKPYAAMFIDGSAKTHENLLDKEKTEIAKHLNCVLKNKLRESGCKPPDKYNNRLYTISIVEDMFKDAIFTADDLPADARAVYYDWLNNDVPIWLQSKVNGLVESDSIPYNRLNRKNVTKYGHYDIVWVLEGWLRLDPILGARDNRLGVEIENQLIEPLFNMERVGFAARKDYLEEAIPKTADYIKERREHFYTLAGEEVKIGQHERILNILRDKFKSSVTTTNNDELEQECANLQRLDYTNFLPEECDLVWYEIDFIETLAELRTLEKWYSTYMIRFQRDLKLANRLYTTINQVGTVSGRVTSDFQQFPKDALTTIYGEELFSPRKLIEVTGGDYDSIVYLDYSQIELRFQALYTILVGHPDDNLCRAYMPFKCHNAFGAFDYNDQWCIKNAYSKDWYYDEEPDKKWTPLDVHGATTKAAFGITEDDPKYKKLRYIGKRVNFAKNYGAKYGKICTMFPDRSAEECKRIDAAYYIAFPGVKMYHNYCYGRAEYSYTINLFGIKYYGVSGHNLINMLIQGSSAYYLKLKILELHKYSKDNHLKTRWQMQIHDELSWEHHKDDPIEIFFDFKQIMEDWADGLVPVIADMEVTTKTWADKKDVETKQALHAYLST